MTGKEYCETCCKNDVCKLREDFIIYYEKANELIKGYSEFFNDIKCRKHLTKSGTIRGRSDE